MPWYDVYYEIPPMRGIFAVRVWSPDTKRAEEQVKLMYQVVIRVKEVKEVENFLRG